jgi:uncharacterized protein (TIGR03066 family)
MRPLSLLVVCVVLSLAGCGKNAKKIVGTWEVTSGPMPPGATLEFTIDGKMHATARVGGVTMVKEGTYEVKGNKLTTSGKSSSGQDMNGTDTIKTLNDKKLVIENKDGRVLEFKRIK